MQQTEKTRQPGVARPPRPKLGLRYGQSQTVPAGAAK